MAVDERLAARIRAVLRRENGVDEIRMFGGLCFTIEGHMACGLVGRDLMVRVGPEGYAHALDQPGARPMDFTGRPLNGFVFVGPAGTRTASALARWIARGVSFARSLPLRRARPLRPRTAPPSRTRPSPHQRPRRRR